MWRRCWKRLAGCIVIELALAAAPAFEYKAGTAQVGEARALALEDRRGNRMVVVQADSAVTREVSDVVAAALIRDYGLTREGLVILGRPGGSADARALLTAATAAMGRMAPSAVRFREGSLVAGGAMVSREGVEMCGECGPGGEAVRSPLRAAFRMVEPEHGLERRGEVAAAYPVQAIALGTQAVILALPGAVPAGRFRAPGRIVLAFANDAVSVPADPRVEEAVRHLLRRLPR
jgi:hypothetical protein